MHALLIGLAVMVALYFWQRRQPTLLSREVRGGNVAYQRLLRKALGDHAQVERLIEYERQRQPRAARDRLIQNALERWERELR